MLNCWCITWPVGFKMLNTSACCPHSAFSVRKICHGLFTSPYSLYCSALYSRRPVVVVRRQTAFLEFPYGFKRMCLSALCNGTVCGYDYIASVTDKWVWSTGGMILRGESGSSRRGAIWNVTFRNTISIRTDPESNPGPRGEKSVTSRLWNCTAIPSDKTTVYFHSISKLNTKNYGESAYKTNRPTSHCLCSLQLWCSFGSQVFRLFLLHPAKKLVPEQTRGPYVIHV